jgi:hypothetical protein
MIGYKVGDNFFYNTYLALYHSFKTNQQIEFICKDNEYDQLDWTQEPKETLEELLLSQILDLRNRYERVILMWSGGTDSHTIYKIFSKYKIHIDEILIKTSTKLIYAPKKSVDWMKKNHYDPSTIITEFDQYDPFLKNIEADNDDWVWKNKGCHLIFGISNGGESVRYLVEKNHSGKKYVLITGHEKPKLVYKNGSWHARFIDRELRPVMGYDDYLCPLYLTPIINLKQCHLLKRSVNELIKKNNSKLNEDDEAEHKWQWKNNDSEYYNYAFACGRVPELNYGLSFMQKVISPNMNFLDSRQQKDYCYLDKLKIKDKILVDYLNNSNSTALNFIKGIFNLYSESKFMYYLHEKKIILPHQLLNPKPIWSKTYNLGP